MIAKAQSFLKEAKAELGKVTWPDRKTTTASTVVVLAVSIVVGLYLFLMDTILKKVIVDLILGS